MPSAPPFYVLTIDDYASVRALIREMLETDGVVVREAANAEAAAASVRERKPDVILLDIVFEEEDMRGYQLCLLLQGMVPGVPIVGLSSRSRPADRQMMERMGAAAYLTKKEVMASPTAGRALLIDTIKRACPAGTPRWS